MVKLTQEIIEQAMQFTNAVRDRQLDLRGLKIPILENLGATLDQFDTLDFSDNEIRKLDGFPLLRRLKCLLLNNNHISRIADGMEFNIPNINSIILTGNRIQELGDLDCLGLLKSLSNLSLLFNPVTKKRYYRLYVIYRIPQLRLLDFQKIKQKDRDASANLFRGTRGAQLASEIGKKSKIFLPPVDTMVDEDVEVKKDGDILTSALAATDINAIKDAISAATTLDEVERLNKLFQSGIPPTVNGLNGAHHLHGEEKDEDEMET